MKSQDSTIKQNKTRDQKKWNNEHHSNKKVTMTSLQNLGSMGISNLSDISTRSYVTWTEVQVSSAGMCRNIRFTVKCRYVSWYQIQPNSYAKDTGTQKNSHIAVNISSIFLAK